MMGDMADMFDGYEGYLDGEGDETDEYVLSTYYTEIKYSKVVRTTDGAILFVISFDEFSEIEMWIPRVLCWLIEKKTVHIHKKFMVKKIREWKVENGF